MALFLGLIFSSIGFVYVVYGRREQDVLFMVTGIVLVVYPYFLSGALLIFGIGVVLTAAPIARHYGWI